MDDTKKTKHLGFWDFIDKQIQDAKKDENDNPQSWKDVLKAIISFVLLFLFIVAIMVLIDLYQRHVGSANPIFG